MAYRNIFIENDCKLSIKNEQLIIEKDNKVVVPLEDINNIVIDNMYISLSIYLLNKISKYNIMLYLCDDKHLPTTLLLNTNDYCRQLKRIDQQYQISKPLKKKIWQTIVKKKVQNQAKCLEILNKDGYEYLNNLSNNVQSGDSTNIEAIAALYYFKKLYGVDFTRRTENIINISLNYGYSIIRSMIARSLVAHGFETSIGIFHHNQLNNFNLADDLIECFRPLVDLYITTNIDINKKELDSNMKKIILNITNQLILINDKKYNIQNAIEYMIESLARSLEKDKNIIDVPTLIKLEDYRYL